MYAGSGQAGNSGVSFNQWQAFIGREAFAGKKQG
jgi:hypothetical protein